MQKYLVTKIADNINKNLFMAGVGPFRHLCLWAQLFNRVEFAQLPTLLPLHIGNIVGWMADFICPKITYPGVGTF